MNEQLKKLTKEQLADMVTDLENQVAELKVKRAKNIKKYVLLNSKIDKKLPKQQNSLDSECARRFRVHRQRA